MIIGSGAEHCCFAVAFVHVANYLSHPVVQPLLGLIALTTNGQEVQIHAAIQLDIPEHRKALESLASTPTALAAYAQVEQLPWLQLNGPLALEPVCIPKPWGQEIWYTGIEARGQSRLCAQGFSAPLPWVLQLMPETLAAAASNKLILLKILDPLPDDIYGDLYFEMHVHKQEVYIVTAIDRSAWPTGEGAIRLGFNSQKRASYADDYEFKQAYLGAVNDYRKVRQAIDERLDQQRIAHHIDLFTPVDAATLHTWQSLLPVELRTAERELRQVMEAFTAMHPLQVGDVVKVPCRVPHALQHGVRTVEFQTPVYERQILSFAQKVLTQSDWDTEAAMAQVIVDTPAQPDLTRLNDNPFLCVEQVVEFDDFEVQRVRLSAEKTFALAATNRYSLLLLISGDLHIHHNGNIEPVTNNSGEHPAFLLPAARGEYCLVAQDRDVTLLLASPRCH